MDISALPARGVEIGAGTFADISTVPVTAVRWDGDRIVVTFDGTLTMAQQVAVQQRMKSINATEEAIRLRASAYLTQPGLASLDDAHVQLRLLTRLVLGIDSKTLPGSNPGQDRA